MRACKLGHGEPVGGRSQYQHRAQCLVHAGFVHSDTADAGGAQLGGGGQLVEDVVGEESGVHTVQRGGEPVGDSGQLRHDLGEFLDHPPAARFGSVVRDGLESKHAFAFGMGLAGQPPEVQLEHGQVKRRCLDRGFDNRGAFAGATRCPRWCDSVS